MVAELADFLLQLARLANFGSMNSLSGQAVPAKTDSVVLVLCCALCLDLVMLGFCIFKRNVFCAMAFHATLNILYTCGPPYGQVRQHHYHHQLVLLAWKGCSYWRTFWRCSSQRSHSRHLVASLLSARRDSLRQKTHLETHRPAPEAHTPAKIQWIPYDPLRRISWARIAVWAIMMAVGCVAVMDKR